MSNTQNDFDLRVVIKGFKECQEKDSGLDMDNYVEAFTELCRFFKIIGTVFSFVAKDIDSKLRILKAHRASATTGQHYSSILGMIEYESQQNILKNNNTNSNKLSSSSSVSGGLAAAASSGPSGSRTLLRLHRALEFILSFMDQVATREDSAKTAEIAGEVYAATLANYHPWLVQKMAYVAMYTLPSKAQLIQLMCKEPQAQVVDLIHETVEQGQPVFTSTQRFFSERGMLDLP